MSLSSRRNKMIEIFHLSEFANLSSHSDCEGNDYEGSPHNSPHELPPELRAEKPPEVRRPLLLVTRIVESPTQPVLGLYPRVRHRGIRPRRETGGCSSKKGARPFQYFPARAW